MDKYADQDQHLIIYSQHYNNWEWAPLCLGLQMKHHLIGAVKTLSNPYMNNYIQNGRAGNNVSVVSTNQIGKFFQNQINSMKPSGVVFIADQRPSGKEKTTPVEFFHHNIDFHVGAANYAMAFGFPIITLDVHRIGRGKYEISAVKLAESADVKSPEALTQMFASHVEALIKKDPAAWLWSHKRFKEEVTY